MPFESKAQARAAFGGYLGPEMEAKAHEFAAATPSMKKLPVKVGKKKDNRIHHGASLADLMRG